MKVAQDKVVALSYVLEVEGNIADSAASDAPLEYIHGTGMLLPLFEQNLEGKEPGESFEFTLAPADGYGEYNPKYKFEIPMAAFEIDGAVQKELLVVGRTLPMLNQDGQVIQGTVAAVGAETVTMDFNHPMAGKTLNFTGKVLSVRDATQKELEEGLHGEFLPQECGHCHGGCHGEGKEGGCHGEGHEGGCCHEGKKEGGCCHEGDKEGCCNNK